MNMWREGLCHISGFYLLLLSSRERQASDSKALASPRHDRNGLYLLSATMPPFFTWI